MEHRILFVAVAALVTQAACQRDPGRDVRPMTPPLGQTASPQTTTEVLPLEQVRKSQAAAVAQRIANTEITITYSRPVARGRELFGALVPHGQVWNPGADQATALAISRDIRVNGQALAAGKYSLWVIPRSESWTVIFSRAADVYHTPYPGEAMDVLRLDVAPLAGPYAEVLTFEFPFVEGKDAMLHLRWGPVAVPLTIAVE